MTRIGIGIDIGGTNIKSVVVDASGNVRHELRAETRDASDAQWKHAIRELVHNLRQQHGAPIDVIGLSAPGLANAANTAIECMPGRLLGLENFVWSDWIGQQVWVLNDAHAAMTAEASFGAARGKRHAVLLTLGTGVGGGIVIDGKLYQGLGQMAGHFGHTTVDADTHLRDVTGMAGSIEEAIGNVSVEQRTHGRYKTTHDLVAAYRAGDTFATWTWLTSVRRLAMTVASAVNIISPEVVVIGGGIAQAGDALYGPLRDFMELYEWRPGGKSTPIVPAAFSDLAGAIGAAAFALSKSDSK